MGCVGRRGGLVLVESDLTWRSAEAMANPEKTPD